MQHRTEVKLVRQNLRLVKQLCPSLPGEQLRALCDLTRTLRLSVSQGEILFVDGKWYVSHAGLLRIALRRRCLGIHTVLQEGHCDPVVGRWLFKATVYKSPRSKGFVGYGDADPSNVSPLVRGAEMRVAETRAVNRALRKAYGIGICSVEEIGSLPARSQPEANVRKLPPQPANGNGEPKLRDQLCLLIREHRLDASLVKQYATEFCGAKDLRQATREQIQSFIAHLAGLAANDREGLLCKLNSYTAKREEGAA
ncbi:MAG: hypothetical protein WA188_08685 [Terriglobales bacterium]